MLEYAVSVCIQILIMAIIVAIGFLLAKKGVLTDTGSSEISKILMKIVLPCVVIKSFAIPFEKQAALDLAQGFLLAVFIYGVPILFGLIFYKNDINRRLCIFVSNNGFFAIPIITALLGSYGVFIGSVHIVVGICCLWSYGLVICGGKTKSMLKTILENPGVIALAVGLALFVLPIELPGFVTDTLTHITNLNTPLAMLVLGAYIANSPIKECVTDKKLWLFALCKLIIIPFALIGIFRILPVNGFVKLSLLIGSCAPTGMVAAMMMQYCGQKYQTATKIVAFTTVLSAFTIPVVITAAKALLL